MTIFKFIDSENKKNKEYIPNLRKENFKLSIKETSKEKIILDEDEYELIALSYFDKNI